MIRQIFNRIVTAICLLFALAMFYGAARDPWAFAQTIGPPPSSGGGGGSAPTIASTITGYQSDAFTAAGGATWKLVNRVTGFSMNVGGAGMISFGLTGGYPMVVNYNYGNNGMIGWSGGLDSTPDTAVARNAAGIVEIDNGTVGTYADLITRSYIAGGSAPTLTGTCTTGSQTGGNTAGTFTATCVSQTVIMTFALTAPNGWACNAHDLSTPADALNQTASSTTTCTLTGTTVASDRISFNAVAY